VRDEWKGGDKPTGYLKCASTSLRYNQQSEGEIESSGILVAYLSLGASFMLFLPVKFIFSFPHLEILLCGSKLRRK
jgi:hypothetical protein